MTEQTSVKNWTYVRRNTDGVHVLVGEVIPKESTSFFFKEDTIELYTTISPIDKGDYLLFSYKGYSVKAMKALKKKEKTHGSG